MATFRNYTDVCGITEDYAKVREFLVRLGYAEFTYARWDWMATHTCLDKTAVGRIGLWEQNGRIVGIATMDCQLGNAFCLAEPEYAPLKREMLLYAKDHLGNENQFGVVIADTDRDFQDIAASLGFIATDKKEYDAAFYPEKTSTAYQLPEGFSITTMRETYDLYQYGQVLWKGFNHEKNGEGVFSPKKEAERAGTAEMLRPNVDLSLKVAAVAPNGAFVSYCGMWYDPQAGFAVIEPVATDPDYRKMGSAKRQCWRGSSAWLTKARNWHWSALLSSSITVSACAPMQQQRSGKKIKQTTSGHAAIKK